ncbi:ABC transporter ATP-binding protein, partial [Lactobacillus delbrueckii]
MLSPSNGYFELADEVKVGYVPQFRNIDPYYPLSIKSFIELNTPFWKSKKVKYQVNHILHETQLKGLADSRMWEASGGQ